jgi:transposase
MRKIKEVLRLKAAGLSVREIARSTGSGRSTVFDYLLRADAAGLAWPLPDELDDGALEAVLFPCQTAAVLAARPVPDWKEVHAELASRKHLTLRLLWLEWRAEHPEGWGYTQYCVHYRRWLDRRDVVMRLSWPAGERMFVDYAGDTVPIVDPATGEITRAQVFVAALGCSGMIYAEISASQSLENWLGAHGRAFSFYGGVPVAVTPDNLKAGVTRACRYDPVLNPSYAELAAHYGTVVLPARAAKPRDKAPVENAVLQVERWVLAPLRHRQFFSLAEADAAVAAKVAELNSRPFRGEATSRGELFESLERPALGPLPGEAFELAVWKRGRVNIDYHVEFDRNYYSVPFRHARQAVEVRTTATTVEVFRSGTRVASHARSLARRRYVTDPAHMPAAHRAHLEWSPSRLISWAQGIGPDVAVFAATLLETRPHPEHSYRACLGLMNLAKRYGPERLAAACARASASGAISYTSVKSILAEGLDRVPVAAPVVLPPPPTHENLRGGDYYAGTDDVSSDTDDRVGDDRVGDDDAIIAAGEVDRAG